MFWLLVSVYISNAILHCQSENMQNQMFQLSIRNQFINLCNLHLRDHNYLDYM